MFDSCHRDESFSVENHFTIYRVYSEHNVYIYNTKMRKEYLEIIMSLYQGFMDNDFLFWLFMSCDNLYSCLMDMRRSYSYGNGILVQNVLPSVRTKSNI